jgi:DNA-binding response OmpR family regulator
LRRGPAVMVAIDDERLRQGCASEIETTGMAATIIADSQEARTGITHRDVRGLIIELEFDGGQGKQLLGRLALAKRRIPIVVICDESFPMDRLPRLPQMKVIAKPVPAHQVYQALATVMGK